MIRWFIGWALLTLSVFAVVKVGTSEDEHTDVVFYNKVKWESHLRSFDHPIHSLTYNETSVVPLTVRSERRKRCSCGCSGCDLFPNRACCSSSCCASSPMPLACCPPPPPPKPCCQPAYGPCCPATPNCCPKPCCRGRRPEYEEYEEEEPNRESIPTPPTPPRTCCPPAVPPPPPPPPSPPPPPPEAPVQCCGGREQPRSPCERGCPNGDCGCAKPCCYYRNPNCCDQLTGVVKPCCPPPLPPLPCCPELQLPQINCIATVPPCLRACPSCPCRKRLSLGKRFKRDDRLHCQPMVKAASSRKLSTLAKAAGAKTVQTQVVRKPVLPIFTEEESESVVQQPPRAGRLYEEHRALRVKRNGCSVCINGRPIIKRTKRSLDCQPCTYLQPQASNSNPFANQPSPQSPVGIPMKREKRASCLPHPQCQLHTRRYKRNLIGSQYCEPCTGHYGRKKREAEIDKCHSRNREKRETNCDVDEFLVTRMKRQAYNPKGVLDVVKLLSKAANSEPSGCVKFPACVLAQKKRRKRMAERYEQYHKAVAEHQEALKEHEKHHRVKRQFFAPNTQGACVPCPAWVTLALASRKKRDTNSKEEEEDVKPMSFKEAIADIRRRKGYELGFHDNDESPRRKQQCDQSDDCLNEVEYAVFKKVYHTRTKRDAVFRRKKCKRCGSGFDGSRVKRAFGGPNINASEQNCMAFPQCRHRVKRNLWDDCNVCTPNLDKRRRKKRNLGVGQCYPCPGTGR